MDLGEREDGGGALEGVEGGGFATELYYIREELKIK